MNTHPIRAFVVLLAISLTLAALGACSSDDDGGTTPSTTGGINGAVLDNQTAGAISGAVVTATPVSSPKKVQSAQTTTGENGEFWFTDLAPGVYDVDVDATNIFPVTGNTDITYVRFLLRETVVAGQNRVIDWPIYLPRIDKTDATSVGAGDVTVTAPSVLGLSLFVAAGSATFPGDLSTGDINLVEIPIDRAPMSLPPGMAPRLLISIQPAGTTFDPPAPITIPNRESLPAGTQLDIVSMDPVDGEFKVAARGQVSTDGLSIQTVGGSGGISGASWHAAVCDEHTVTGTVQIAGAPAVGATVDVLSGVNTSTGIPVVIAGGSATTDAQGAYSIPGIRLCNVTVRATVTDASGSGLAVSAPMQTDGSGTTDMGTLTVTIVPDLILYDVAGTVRFLDGTPAPGTLVSTGFARKETGKQNYFDITDAAGNYRLSDLLGNADEEIDVFASNETAQGFGQRTGTVPPQSGTTVNLDLTLCTQEDFLETCLTAAWSLLTGTTMRLVSDLPIEACSDDEGLDTTITLTSLQNGVLTIDVPPDGEDPAETVTFSRVQGSGPTVSGNFTQSDILGIYRFVSSTDPPNPGETSVIAFRPGGEFGQVDGQLGDGIDAGTYTWDGTEITATSIDLATGTPGASQTFPFALQGNNTIVLDTGEGPETFNRCEETAGTGVEGFWLSDDPDSSSYLMIQGNEFGVGSLADLSNGGPTKWGRVLGGL